MNSAGEFADALRAVSRGGTIRPPADAAMISQSEARHGIHLPVDMTSFYRSMNGMDWPTEPDKGWIRFWELNSWRRVRDEPGLRDVSLYDHLGDAVLLADHCDSSWYYAADFSQSTDELQIWLIDGLRPAKLVAASFTTFVNAVLADAEDIYPDEREAGQQAA